MGVRFPSIASTTFVGPLPANATETVVLTTPPLNISLDFSQILLTWFSNILLGTGTTSLTYKIRRGTTITGTQVGGFWADAGTAGTNIQTSGNYIDTPGAVAGQQYTLTVIQNGATAAGTFGDGCLSVFAL